MKHKDQDSKLHRVEFDFDWECPVPSEVESLLGRADFMLQSYWDQWHKQPIEQYVACDFRDVWRALQAITQNKLAVGNTFCEWGAGFGIITGLASMLGWDAVGIEAEPFLVEQALVLQKNTGFQAEFLCGNFLPYGAEKLARGQANHASLFHRIPPAYDNCDLQCDDFALVFAYPWPGEHFYLQEVFRNYGGDQALLLMFLGPYEIELFRKSKT